VEWTGKTMSNGAEFCVSRAALWRNFDNVGRAAFGRKF
jgi:hypothetical protein